MTKQVLPQARKERLVQHTKATDRDLKDKNNIIVSIDVERPLTKFNIPPDKSP